jgi:hypothetical protein
LTPRAVLTEEQQDDEPSASAHLVLGLRDLIELTSQTWLSTITKGATRRCRSRTSRHLCPTQDLRDASPWMRQYRSLAVAIALWPLPHVPPSSRENKICKGRMVGRRSDERSPRGKTRAIYDFFLRRREDNTCCDKRPVGPRCPHSIAMSARSARRRPGRFSE